jgi:hypothetical protein
MITGTTQQQVLTNVQTVLMKLRDALWSVSDMHNWTAAQSAQDLINLGFTAADANMVLSAMADANVFSQMYDTGTMPASYGYTAPANPYIFGQSQRAVIGPQ